MSSRLLRVIPVCFLALAVLACNLPLAGRVQPSPVPTFFDLAATMTVEAQQRATQRPTQSAPRPTDTHVPVVQISPVKGVTPVRQATATRTGVPVVQITPVQGVTPVRRATVTRTSAAGGNPGAARRINFAANATQATVSATVNGNGAMREYVVRASAGQILQVGVFSPEQNAVLSLYIPSTGQVLLSRNAARTDWAGRLPASTDYVARVTSTGGTAAFTLTVTIMETIRFQPGAISATRSYPIAAQDVHTFSLRAIAEQTMTVEIISPGDNVLLSIYGFEDGQPYKRSSVGDPYFSFELPITQDYIIQAVSDSDSPTSFTLNVTVE